VPNPFTVTATYPWFQTGIQVPAAIAIGSDGMLYVLHATGNGHEDASSRPTVSVIDRKTGRPIRSWGQYGTGPGQLDLTSTDDNPALGCIQVAPDGLVYVGEEGNHRVEVFKPDGTLVRQIGVGKLGKVQYCVLGPDGSLYAVNTWEGPTAFQMSKFSPNGELVWQGYADPEHPSVDADQVGGIAFLPDGHILGFNNRGGVLMDPANGRVVGQWGSQQTQLGPDESFISLDTAGHVYVNTGVFDPQGRLLFDKRGQIGFEGWFGENGCSVSHWPPPVFDKEGFGYSFDCDGLVQLKVTLPTG
jgi:streptogramin lyase